jgi:hypothetical protein
VGIRLVLGPRSAEQVEFLVKATCHNVLVVWRKLDEGDQIVVLEGERSVKQVLNDEVC